MKKCKDCAEIKPLSEFVANNRTLDGRTNQCKDCRNMIRRMNYKADRTVVVEQNKKWRKTEKGKLYLRKAGKMPHAKQTRKEWAQNNKERVREINDNWRRENPEEYAEICRQHARKSNARRRRNLGFNPLNTKFLGSVGHHINRNDVIYIPEQLHRSIPHRQGDEESMNKINELAINWCDEQGGLPICPL